MRRSSSAGASSCCASHESWGAHTGLRGSRRHPDSSSRVAKVVRPALMVLAKPQGGARIADGDYPSAGRLDNYAGRDLSAPDAKCSCDLADILPSKVTPGGGMRRHGPPGTSSPAIRRASTKEGEGMGDRCFARAHST